MNEWIWFSLYSHKRSHTFFYFVTSLWNGPRSHTRLWWPDEGDVFVELLWHVWLFRSHVVSVQLGCWHQWRCCRTSLTHPPLLRDTMIQRWKNPILQHSSSGIWWCRWTRKPLLLCHCSRLCQQASGQTDWAPIFIYFCFSFDHMNLFIWDLSFVIGPSESSVLR